MKIVQINATYGNADSTGRNVKETHQWLKDHNFESIVYTASFNEQPPVDPNVRIFSNVIDKVSWLVVKTHRIAGVLLSTFHEKTYTTLKKRQSRRCDSSCFAQ